jgi:hypothetical protein
MSRYRRALRNSVAAEARAFGFSLVVLCTGYLCVQEHGLPHVSGAFAFLGGALLAQVLIACLAFRSPLATWSAGEEVEYYAFASLHVVSVIAAALTGWGVAAAVSGHNLAYFLTALASLLVYGVLLAAELAFAMQRDQ